MSTQEQNTPRRDKGYYWVRIEDEWYIAEYLEYLPGKFDWQMDDRSRSEEYFDEIDERKIVRV